MKRYAQASWIGSGKEGKGSLTSQSGVLSEAQYSFNTRFADGVGTNPEELVASAHAGCFSMKLAFVLAAAGGEPESIETKCTITLGDGSITNSHLEVKVKVDLDADKFKAAVEDAKANCPISKLLNTEITAEAVQI